MNPRRIFTILIVVITAAIGVAFWRAHTHTEPSTAQQTTPERATAFVKTAKIVRKTIAEKIIAYGSVIAQPGKLQTVSLAYEARVNHVLVAPGQLVKTGDPVLEVAASPATQLLVNQARSAAELARKELQQTKERFDLKLATNQELNAAQKAATDADLQLASFEKEGADNGGVVRASSEGIVANLAVQDGQLVPAGNALVEIIAKNEVEAKIGVEPENVSLIAPGGTISLFPVNQPDSQKIDGTIRLVTLRINPTSRLVDVYVTFPADSGLLLDGYLRAEVRRASGNALIVPRSAVLPKGDAWQIFTIHDGRAVAHTVRLGIVSDGAAEVITSDLQEGESVVSLGNYELEDGMAVEVGP